MKKSTKRTRALALDPLEDRRMLYAQSVHQWIAAEAHEFYAAQFGASNLDGGIDEIQTGAFNEDEPGENPFGNDSLLDSPSLRHFWGHNASFQRSFDDGYSNYDSAPNRAIKYITGGYGYTGALDGEWEPAAGQGAAALYAAGNLSAAYDYLGHAAHLLQDIALPAHSHNDAHLDGFGSFDDPDPFHDWADGVQFSTSGAGDLPVAAFNEAADANRAANWPLPGTANSAALRSAYDIDSGFTPGAGAVDAEALYRLFQATAALSDDYDTKDVNGQVDAGARRNNSSTYSNWTRAELVQMAEVLIPRSILDNAELYRYFQGVVDSQGPLVALTSLTSGDPAAPQIVGTSVTVTAAATDQLLGNSGVGKGLFQFEYREQQADESFSTWQPLTGSSASSAHFANGAAFGSQFANRHGASSQFTFTGLPGVLYEFRVTAEDGGGNTSTSNSAYVRFAGVVVVGNTLIVTGAPIADNIELTTPAANTIDLKINGAGQGQFTAASVTVFGGAGGDTVLMKPSAFNTPATLYGGLGDDSLTGGYADDLLYGEDGDDTLIGSRGNDELWCGIGNDYADGRSGDDLVRGGDGNDRLKGDLGNDVLLGELGRDRLRAGAGNDILIGSQEADRLYGEGGRDLLSGGIGLDLLSGGSDDDILIGGATTHDADLAALAALLAEWSSAKSYDDRANNLVSASGAAPALNSPYFISSATTPNDNRADELSGDTGRDWFPRNEALDAASDERVTF